ncbi:hypothetical protein BDA96_10G048800 [Sorghum bicolor]|uniref:Uncharacterized protein n=1 Tax=Sorghum bicolor TaxID=4558 RepID=A0A921Q0G1_SORBI|nr:hypothetical protein BDA96_10G048800 [Sorghum bicolor]
MSGSQRRRMGEKEGTSSPMDSKKNPRRGGGWSARKRQRKAGERITARKAREVRAARTRLGSEGRRRKISRRRSSPRE